MQPGSISRTMQTVPEQQWHGNVCVMIISFLSGTPILMSNPCASEGLLSLLHVLLPSSFFTDTDENNLFLSFSYAHFNQIASKCPSSQDRHFFNTVYFFFWTRAEKLPDPKLLERFDANNIGETSKAWLSKVSNIALPIGQESGWDAREQVQRRFAKSPHGADYTITNILFRLYNQTWWEMQHVESQKAFPNRKLKMHSYAQQLKYMLKNEVSRTTVIKF